MKGLIFGLIIAAIGFSLMAFSYFNYQYDPGSSLWKDAFMYIGKGQPPSESREFEYATRPIRLLPIPRRAENFVPLAKSFSPQVEKSYRFSFQEKVVLYTSLSADFSENELEWGRLPLPDADEAVAGFYAGHKDKILLNGRSFKVVGQFSKTIRLFVDSYLVCDNDTGRELFDPNDSSVQQAHILRLPPEQLTDLQMQERLEKAFPKSEFVPYKPVIRVPSGSFYLYIVGMFILFLGGFWVLYKLYCLLSEKLSNRWLVPPLAEIRRYKYLFIALHVICFGTVILLMLVAYQLPELQISLLAGVKSQVAGGYGPLGVAGKAYMSKNIPLAAVTTVVINFFIGSLAVITLPSLILPGAGILVLGFRSLLWGLLLAPSFADLSGAMIPHSLTLLLEGEAYIVAGFFALLVPIYLLRKTEGPGLVNRYGRALLMNVRSNLLVAIILVIAAIYEAIEVIMAMK
ncbi:MAG: hypothetical protein JXA81_05600 [Sedimentisphaerales bacterium]|nr:hypothetical protein [Sedimentisphaerales bacterium]